MPLSQESSHIYAWVVCTALLKTILQGLHETKKLSSFSNSWSFLPGSSSLFWAKIVQEVLYWLFLLGNASETTCKLYENEYTNFRALSFLALIIWHQPHLLVIYYFLHLRKSLLSLCRHRHPDKCKQKLYPTRVSSRKCIKWLTFVHTTAMITMRPNSCVTLWQLLLPSFTLAAYVFSFLRSMLKNSSAIYTHGEAPLL